MAANTDANTRMLDILKKEKVTDDDLEELQRLSSQLGSLMGTFSSTLGREANFRMSIELIVAIRGFDKASAGLIATTNKLTKQILWLTRVGIAIALIALIPVVRDFLSFLAGK